MPQEDCLKVSLLYWIKKKYVGEDLRIVVIWGRRPLWVQLGSDCYICS